MQRLDVSTNSARQNQQNNGNQSRYNLWIERWVKK